MSSEFTFHNHENLRGQHALFSPSQSSWLRYDDDKIAERVVNQYRAPVGTEIHEFAATQIEMRHRVKSIKNLIENIENYIYTKYTFLSNDLRISQYGMSLIENVRILPREVFEAVRSYINDGVGFKMTPEQPLVYSENSVYGTTDAILFRDNFLRIHDLKTGTLPGHMEQLKTYAALFCLEYGIKPKDISIELRMYQWDGITIEVPEIPELVEIMDQIIRVGKITSKISKED